MRLDWFFFIVLVAMCLTVVGAMGTAGFESGGRVVHPEFPTMDRSWSADRAGMLPWFGWVLGALQVVSFVICLAFSLRESGRLPRAKWALIAGGVLLLGVFTAMFLADQEILVTSRQMLLGPFPVATTLMLLGMWLAPLYFVLLYAVMFRRWFVTPEDLKKFERLMRARREASEEP